MNFPLSSVNKPKVGTCPHGLPHGACPVCSGMGGGGGGASRKVDRPTGEMSWDECYAVWQQMLKAKDLAQQKRNDAAQAQMQTPLNFTAKLNNMAQKIANLAEKLTNFAQKAQKTPTLMSKTLAVAAKLAIPILNMLKNIPLLTQKAISFIQEKLADITDKLNAVFGELKNKIEEKISDRLKNFKKKFKSLFSIFDPTEAGEEEKQTEESKRLFEFKNIFKLKKNKKELKNDTSSESN